MATLQEIRQQYPQYADLSDDELARGLHEKFYRDMPFADFSQRIGLQSTQPKMTPEQTALAQQSPSFLAQLASAAVRPVVKGVTAVPLMAMDAGVGVRNFLQEGRMPRLQDFNPFAPAPGGGTELPSQVFNRALDTHTLPPEGAAGKGAELVSSVLTGARLPAPQAAAQAPKGFAATPVEQMLRAETLRRAREAGYVIPPATAKPSLLNQVMEGAAGKVSTAQQAAQKNQEITNQLARKAIGLGVDDQLSPAALKAIRNDAGAVYRAIDRTGDIATDAQYLDELKAMSGAVDEIAKAFPKANVGARKQITDLVDSLKETKFDARAAMQFVKELRREASGNLSRLAAADPAKRALGTAQRQAAEILEAQIERHLAANGHEILARSFANARRLIAKTHSVESALNRGTGNVSATKLAAQADKGAPLSGDLKLVADFARTAPKATREINESVTGVSPWDFGWGSLAGGLGAAATGSPEALALGLLYPGARVGLRQFMLSPTGQRVAMDGISRPSPGALMGGSALEEQLRQ